MPHDTLDFCESDVTPDINIMILNVCIPLGKTQSGFNALWRF